MVGPFIAVEILLICYFGWVSLETHRPLSTAYNFWCPTLLVCYTNNYEIMTKRWAQDEPDWARLSMFWPSQTLEILDLIWLKSNHLVNGPGQNGLFISCMWPSNNPGSAQSVWGPPSNNVPAVTDIPTNSLIHSNHHTPGISLGHLVFRTQLLCNSICCCKQWCNCILKSCCYCIRGC